MKQLQLCVTEETEKDHSPGFQPPRPLSPSPLPKQNQSNKNQVHSESAIAGFAFLYQTWILERFE
jgi:hypothetical protein